MPGGYKPLGLNEVADLLAASPEARDAILVGGQALNALAVHYGLESPATALSEDIDFFAGAGEARAAGKAWGGKTKTTTLDDHTPNSAYVMITIGGVIHQIDFMAQIAGVDAQELKDWATRIEADGKSFLVMHPIHVLQSQLENVYGQLNRRSRGPRMVDRTVLSTQVASSAIRQYLEEGETRAALKVVERIGELAGHAPGLRAWREDGVNVLAAIPDHPAWPKAFVRKRLPQIRGAVVAKREKSVPRLK